MCDGFEPGSGTLPEPPYRSANKDRHKCWIPQTAAQIAADERKYLINETCIRALCESSAKCGGYQIQDATGPKAQGETYTQDVALYGLNIINPSNVHPHHFQCWAKPQATESSCTYVVQL